MFSSSDQADKFATYKSLNFHDKIYQIKALQLFQKYFHPTKKNLNFLEIGCADGTFLEYVSTQIPHFSGKLFGLDISGQKNSRVDIRRHDLNEKLPFKDNFFDCVFALETIEHIYYTNKFISEIQRTLVSGGLLIISTPNLASVKNRIRLLFGASPEYLETSEIGAGHIHMYTLGSLSNQIKQHHMEIITSVAANFPGKLVTRASTPEKLRQFLIKLGDYIPQYGSHIILIARKP